MHKCHTQHSTEVLITFTLNITAQMASTGGRRLAYFCILQLFGEQGSSKWPCVFYAAKF